jgi:hypothetical protein
MQEQQQEQKQVTQPIAATGRDLFAREVQDDLAQAWVKAVAKANRLDEKETNPIAHLFSGALIRGAIAKELIRKGRANPNATVKVGVFGEVFKFALDNAALAASEYTRMKKHAITNKDKCVISVSASGRLGFAVSPFRVVE